MGFSVLPDHRAAADPDGRAVADSSQSLTNTQLLGRVRAAAGQLVELGVGPGDVLALRLVNRVEFVVLMFAAWRIGAAVTPINPALTDREVMRQLDDSGAVLLVGEPGTTQLGAVLFLDVVDLRSSGTSGPDEPVHDPSALGLVIYTSGTTGTPKGVMLDHANLDAMTAMACDALDLGVDDRCLLILPLFHVNGIVVSVLTPLLAGASVVIADRFDPTTFFDVVEAERPTYFSAVPTIYSMLATLPPDVQPDTSSLSFVVCGAAPASSTLLADFESRFGVPILEGYGLSEGTCASTLNPRSGIRKPGTVGPALPGQEIRIASPSGAAVGTGEVGEVLVRGANVMRGYLGRPADTAATIVDGWLRTGDLGRLDVDGYLTLVGRSKELIIRGGENIYPKEIEDVLTAFPTVAEAAVIGMPDEKWGEVVVAFVQPRPGQRIDLDDLQARCRENLSRYKQPSLIHVHDLLPKNAVGKLDKKALIGLTTSRSSVS